jgi:DHA2 family multidrug resistance protein
MSNNAPASFTPPSLVLSTIGLSLATFMQVLDTTIANVALPTISGNLGVSSDQGTWVITSFAVSNAIALPLTGWLSRRFGEVKLFIWATLLFVIASFLCGISTSMPELVGFRVVQGLVAGPLYPMAQTLLIAVYPPAKRGMALALLGRFLGAGSPTVMPGRGSSSSTCRLACSPLPWCARNWRRVR